MGISNKKKILSGIGLLVVLIIVAIVVVIVVYSIPLKQIPSPNLYHSLIEYGKAKIDYNRPEKIDIYNYPDSRSYVSGVVTGTTQADSHIEVYSVSDTLYPLNTRVKFEIDDVGRWNTEDGPYELSGNEKDNFVIRKAMKYNPPVVAMVRMNREVENEPVTTATIYKPTGLVRSFDTSNMYLQFRTYSYDQALVLLSACVLKDSANAKIIADALVKIQTPNGLWPFSVLTISGVATDPYYRTGAIMWIIYSLAFAIKSFGKEWGPGFTDICKQSALKGIDHLIDQYLVTDAGDMRRWLFKGGKGRYTGEIFDANYMIEWCANEHNVDAYFALKLLNELGYSKVNTKFDYGLLCKNLANVMITVLWDDKEKIARQAVQNASMVSQNNSLDNNTWYASMAADMGHLDIAIDAIGNAEKYYYLKNQKIAGTNMFVSGFKTYSTLSDEPATTDVWIEGTAGVIHAYKMIAKKSLNPFTKYNYTKKANDVLAGYKNMEDPAGHYGIKCSSGAANSEYCVAATAWTILAMVGSGFWGL